MSFGLSDLFERGTKTRRKQMKQFTRKEKKPTTGVPVMDFCIDTESLDQIRVGVYHNSDIFTAEIQFEFDKLQKGFNDVTATLRNNLHPINNIAYKQPAQLTFASEWYSHAVNKAREFTKKHNSNLHTKLGYRFEQRYHTIPYTYFSYDPALKEFLLQVSIPADDHNEFTHHLELEGELTQQGKRNLHFDWFS